MAEYAGSAAVFNWIYSGGTVSLQADFRTFSWAPTLNFIDATAGQDTYENLVESYGVGGAFSLELLAQTDGDNVATALARSTGGTLEYGPRGSATGAIKYSIPCTSQGPQWSSPFNDVTTLTGSWRQTSAETSATWS